MAHANHLHEGHDEADQLVEGLLLQHGANEPVNRRLLLLHQRGPHFDFQLPQLSERHLLQQMRLVDASNGLHHTQTRFGKRR